MRPRDHVIASTLVSSGVYAFTQSWTYTALSWAGGVLIDADHMVDYIWLRKRVDPLPVMMKYYATHYSPKIFLFFHGFEWIPIVFGFGWMTGVPDLSVAFLVGYTQHLALDQFANNLHRGFYFLSLRIYHRFEGRPLCPYDYPSPATLITPIDWAPRSAAAHDMYALK